MAAIRVSRLAAQADPLWNKDVDMPLSNIKNGAWIYKILKKLNLF